MRCTLTVLFKSITAGFCSKLSRASCYDPARRISLAARAEPTNCASPAERINMEEKAVEIFRLLSLLLPPENRRKLQLLLKFIRKVPTGTVHRYGTYPAPKSRLMTTGRVPTLLLFNVGCKRIFYIFIVSFNLRFMGAPDSMFFLNLFFLSKR